MSRYLALAPAASFLALIAVFAGFILFHHNPKVSPRATVGQPAPNAVLPTLASGTVAPLKAAIQGPTLVNFFASWCAPCAQEAPTLMALKAEGVRIVGVAWKDDPAASRAFLAKFGDPYALALVDRDGRTGIDFGISGVPETYLVGPDGRIIDKQAEPLTADSAEALLAKAR
ncbi:MAG: redoxin family protein [Caulobacteraceae bacterium]|nr:redoxin family protein [Caulobacteraceae bacterium]